MKTIQEQIEIMTSFANGAKVECLAMDKSLKGWYDKEKPSFSWGFFDYRIKEQKKAITIEKCLVQFINTERFEVKEGNDVFYKDGKSIFEKVKLLETYEVEI